MWQYEGYKEVNITRAEAIPFALKVDSKGRMMELYIVCSLVNWQSPYMCCPSLSLLLKQEISQKLLFRLE